MIMNQHIYFFFFSIKISLLFLTDLLTCTWNEIKYQKLKLAIYWPCTCLFTPSATTVVRQGIVVAMSAFPSVVHIFNCLSQLKFLDLLFYIA